MHRPPGPEVPDLGLNLLTPQGGPLVPVISLPHVGHHCCRGLVPYHVSSLPMLLDTAFSLSLWLQRPALPVVGHFQSELYHSVVALVCLWEEASSGFFFAIFFSPSRLGAFKAT